MVVLKHIGVLSAALIAALIELVAGFVFAIFTLAGVLGPFIGTSTCSSSGLCGLLFGGGILVLIALPIFAMVVGFLATALETWLYNVVSKRIGGVKLQFKNNQLKNIDPMSAQRSLR
jgi:hypothetical protein